MVIYSFYLFLHNFIYCFAPFSHRIHSKATVCPFNTVFYYIKWGKPFWTYCKIIRVSWFCCPINRSKFCIPVGKKYRICSSYQHYHGLNQLKVVWTLFCFINRPPIVTFLSLSVLFYRGFSCFCKFVPGLDIFLHSTTGNLAGTSSHRENKRK